jgi:hypothetical protein
MEGIEHQEKPEEQDEE